MVVGVKKLLTLVLALIMMMYTTGCGLNEESKSTSMTTQEGTQQVNKGEEPYEFTIFRSTWTDLNEETDSVIREINKRLNVKIKILSAPYEAWIEKYNLLIISGQVPDLSVTTGPGTINFDAWAQQGIFLDITELYPKYCPDVINIIKNDIIEAHKIDGKLYGIPKPSLSDSTFAIRVDWLEKLNLSMPKTLDELYNVLKAFRDNDPDGNRKNDTYGLLSEDTLNAISIIFGAFECSVPPNVAENWIPDGNGKLTSALLAPGMKPAIKYITNLYREKILDQEWMMTKSQAFQEKVRKGKVGLMPVSFQSMISETEARIRAYDQSAELAILDGVTGPSGKYVRQMQKGYYMVSSISSKAKNPQKILQFLNFLITKEGDNLLRFGIEGMTYTKEGGGEIGHKFRQILQPAVLSIPGNDPRNRQIMEMAKVLFEGPFYPAPTLQPPSLKTIATKQGADYVKNSVTAIITGKGDPEVEWDKFIKNWRDTGGDLLIKEINEIYTRNSKKQ